MAKCKIKSFDIDCPLFDNPEEDCWYNEEHRCSATKGLKYVEKAKATDTTTEKKKRWFSKKYRMRKNGKK